MNAGSRTTTGHACTTTVSTRAAWDPCQMRILMRRGATLVIQGLLRHSVPAFAIRKGRPHDDTFSNGWMEPGGALTSAARPVGTAFFFERKRPNDVLVADVDGVVVGYAKSSVSRSRSRRTITC